MTGYVHEKKQGGSSRWTREGVVLLYVMRFASGDVRFCAHRDEIDEERDEYADQGIEYAIQGEAGDAAVCAVRDCHAQKGDAGNIGQGAFTHEIGKNDQWGDSEEFAFPRFFKHV